MLWLLVTELQKHKTGKENQEIRRQLNKTEQNRRTNHGSVKPRAERPRHKRPVERKQGLQLEPGGAGWRIHRTLKLKIWAWFPSPPLMSILLLPTWDLFMCVMVSAEIPRCPSPQPPSSSLLRGHQTAQCMKSYFTGTKVVVYCEDILCCLFFKDPWKAEGRLCLLYLSYCICYMKTSGPCYHLNDYLLQVADCSVILQKHL